MPDTVNDPASTQNSGSMMTRVKAKLALWQQGVGSRSFWLAVTNPQYLWKGTISICSWARGGPGYLNRFSASISGVSARVRLPSGGAAVGSRLDRVSCRQGSNVVSGCCRSPGSGRVRRGRRLS